MIHPTTRLCKALDCGKPATAIAMNFCYYHSRMVAKKLQLKILEAECTTEFIGLITVAINRIASKENVIKI